MKFLGLTALLVLLAGFGPNDNAGTLDGGGGDAYAAEFVQTAYEVLQKLSVKPLAEVTAGQLAIAVANTKVNSVEGKLVLRGQQVDAINYPKANPQRIELSRDRRLALKGNPSRRKQLVLHEYLGILGVDDTRYQVSHRLEELRVCERREEIKNALVRAIGLSCDRIVPSDLADLETLTIKDLTSLRVEDFDSLLHVAEIQFAGNALIEEIPAGFFSRFPNLEEVEFLQPVRVVRTRAFAGLNLPSGKISLVNVGRIEAYAFADTNAGLVDLNYKFDPRDWSRFAIEDFAFSGFEGGNFAISKRVNTEITDQTFAGIKNVSSLEIRSDRFTAHAFEGVKSAKTNLDLTLKLAGNPADALEVFDAFDVELAVDSLDLVPENSFRGPNAGGSTLQLKYSWETGDHEPFAERMTHVKLICRRNGQTQTGICSSR